MRDRSVAKKTIRTLLTAVLALAVLFAFTAAPYAAKAAEAGGVSEYPRSWEDYRRWAQGDARWGSIRLGRYGRTVAQAGCLVTSVTKLIIQSGLRDSSSFNVATLVNWLNSHGGLTYDGNLVWSKPAEMIAGFSFLGAEYYSGYSWSSAIQKKIMDHVRAGHHVVLTVKNYGHYVAVDNKKSLAMGQVYIMDSLNDTSTNADIALTSRYSYVSRLCVYAGCAGAAPAEPEPQDDYLSRCSYSMNHYYARVRSASAYFYTLPCTANAGEGSEAVGRAPQDELIEITGELTNPADEQWYEVRTDEGKTVYIWGGQIEFDSYINDLEIDAQKPPSGTLEPGKWYALSEHILSRHSISAVTGRITDAEANEVYSASVSPLIRGKYDVVGTEIDAALTFGSLEEGHYTYEIFVKVKATSRLTDETAVFYRIFTSPFSVGVEALPVYTVSFVDSLTEEEIQRESIAEGFMPVMPLPPFHEGFDFTGWSEEGPIAEDTVIFALYADEAAETLIGDVNSDGQVTVLDAVQILRRAMGEEFAGFNEEAADVNGDGEITVLDSVLALRIAMGDD